MFDLRPRKLETIEDIRDAITHHRKVGKQIIRHFNKMEEYYSSWEDMLVQIDRAIDEVANITGATKEEIKKPIGVLEELFGDDI